MLQLLLAFLAISIVSVTGYGLMEQLSLQQIMVDQRENARRLDVAADAIAGHLVTVAGSTGVYAPAPENVDGWSHMPAGVGGINATVDGTAFLYCPVAPGAGATNGQVALPGGGSYAIQVKGGAVVGSSLALQPGMSDYQPVAYIVAAGRGRSTPPSCAGVGLNNGRPFVANGLVKVVSLPAGAQGAGTIAASASDVWVVDGGSGSGREDRPASIEDALRQWVNFRPSNMTIHLSGSSVTVHDAALWSAFASALRSSPSHLTIVGDGTTLVAPGGQIGAPGVLSLAGVALQGPTIVVEQGDEFNVQGNVSLLPSNGGSGVYVQQGGRLNVSGGILRIGGDAQNGVEAAGDVTLRAENGSPGGIAAGGKTWSLALTSGGRLMSIGGVIGDPGSRNSSSGLVVAGTWSVTSDGSSSVAAAGSGSCWSALDPNDATFSQSANGQGSVSTVVADPAPVVVTDPSDQAQMAAYQQYRRDVDARQRARQTNHSNFQCV